MLEDLTMDKKSAPGVRANQFPAKQGGSNNNNDCKKLQDGAGIPKGRGPRKRESALPSSSKNDQHRQRNKTYDKRPRPRGQYNADRKEDPQVEETRADYDSALSLGRKKVNLNHLLNFHYAPKDAGTNGCHVGTKNWHHASQRHKFNKEQFLQANCQFLVKAGGDYTRYLNDPDTLVEWDLIEQIRVMSSEQLSCPICLCKPTAARITKCGHVFCWPCIIHYLDLGEKSWRKCPICYESVYKDDMKSVTATVYDEMKIGDVVGLRLMKRERGSLAVVAVGNHARVNSDETANNNRLCKLIIADPCEAFAILEKDTLELKERLQDEEGTPEICFTEQAVEILEQRKNFLESKTQVGRVAEPQSNLPEEAQHESPDNASSLAYQQVERIRRDTCSSEGQLSCKSDEPFEDVVLTEQELAADVANKNKKFFYFYQADDGQQVYLHPLNVHMLEYMYGSLETSPAMVKGRIVEKEAGSMTPDLRQRLRYLQHLPVTCQFEVVELEFRPPVVSKQTLECFREQVDSRKRKRQRRAREENKIEKRVLEEENKHYGRFPSPNMSIESFQHFPECGSVGSPPADHPSTDIVEEMEDLHLDSGSSGGGPSFSQMLQGGKRQSAPVWGAKFHASVSTPQLARDADEAPDPDGYVPAPSFSKSFGDAFALAMQQAENAASSQPEETTTGRKKKKNKQKVLFSTNMACNSK